MSHNNFIHLLVVFVLVFSCCNQSLKHSEDEIKQAMHHYDQLIERMDADSIAMQYTVDGQLGAMATGRDSISRFLKKFINVRVISNESVTDSVIVNDTLAVQKGKYNQLCIIDGKDTMRPKGSFTVHWVWLSGEGWKIKKMETVSQQ